MVANNLIGVCEALLYASKVGLDERKLGTFLFYSKIIY